MHIAFARLVKERVEDDRRLWRVLSDGYRYKEIADYGIDPSIDVSDAAAARIIADATRFVARIGEILEAPPP